MKTIKLSGNDYAPVDERIREFHKMNANGSIRTAILLQGDKLIEARATVIPDVKNPERYFTGSAVGYLGKEKALEKLETVAVGRALAFAGLLADGRIASFEEMERFQENDIPEPAPVAPVYPVVTTITSELVKQIESHGYALYGSEWTAKKKELVTAISKGSANSMNELLQKEGEKMLSGICKKMEESGLNLFGATPDKTPF